MIPTQSQTQKSPFQSDDTVLKSINSTNLKGSAHCLLMLALGQLLGIQDLFLKRDDYYL